MTKILETKVSDWKKPEQGPGVIVADGYILNTVGQTDMCKFYGLPGVLPKVDAAHNTRVVVDVMQATTNEPVKFLVDDEKNEIISPIDPRSNFITDEQFDTMKNEFLSRGFDIKEAPTYHKVKWGDAWFEAPFEGDSSVMGDAIRKTIQIQRMPQGGCHLSMGIIRQICTNGAVVKEKEYSHLSRTMPFTQDHIENYIKVIGGMDLQQYLMSKWFVDGKPIEASVGDYYGMRSTLLKATDKETADISFPTEPIVDFYKSQNIEIGEINNNLRNRIPSGLSYYDCFNILTHGMKQVPTRTLEHEIEIAGWGFGRRLRQLAQTQELAFTGKPRFDQDQLRLLRGDRRVA